MDILYRIMHLIQLVDTSQSPFVIFSGGSGGHGGRTTWKRKGFYLGTVVITNTRKSKPFVPFHRMQKLGFRHI